VRLVFQQIKYLHVDPVGLNELVTYKYEVYGSGQIRK